MNCLIPKIANRVAVIETLEQRTLLDAGLGTEIGQFASQDELATALIDRAVSQYEWAFGQEVQSWICDDRELCVPEYVLLDGIGAPGTAVPGGSFSDTNVQVEGVDEGDLVETDGDYVYILSDRMVSIVDVRDAAHPRVASRVALEADSGGTEMYLHGDRLMVLSTSWYFDTDPIPLLYGGSPGIIADGSIDAFWWAPSRPSVVATVIDVSDRDDAAIVSRTEVDGSLANSRAIDGRGYLVVDDYPSFPAPEIKAQTVTPPGEEPKTVYVYQTEDEYRAYIAPTILDVLPEASTYDATDVLVSSSPLAEYDATYRTTDSNFGSIVSVVTIDMHADLPSIDEGATVMMNSGNEIFMSADSLYLFQGNWGQNQTTSIMKLDVSSEDGSVKPVASGTVPGRLLDQFSADEMNQQLRIATTSDFGSESSSGVYVLNQFDEGLEIVGSVEKLAPGEHIYSAHFLGTMAYVVTFRQVDPLFAVDLTAPENPTVRGELKIPGFSEYLQPIDGEHLLAIGRDADPVTGRSDALQLSLFNVADATAPKLVDRYTFEGGRSTHSFAEYDHHAFRYFPEYETLAIPVSSHGGGAWIREDDGTRFWIPAKYNENLQVFRIDVDGGFEFAGAIEHPSPVRRSLRVNDALFSLSFDTLKVNSITDLANASGQLYYLPPQHGGVVPAEPKAEDIDRLFEQMSTTENDPRFDMDGNALVNTDDVAFLVEAVLETKAGDIDLDNDVDFRDFVILSANFGDDGGWAEGDLNGDGQVTFADFTILSSNFGYYQDV